jgi:hypothetical protein
MSLPQLQLVPQSSGYAAAHGKQVVSTELDGGAARYRLDVLGMTAKVNVQFQLSDVGYNYLMAFYRTKVSYGSLPFQIQLLLDSSTLTWYTATFIPGSLQLAQQEGLVYIVRGQLEVVPQPPGATADNATVSGYVPGT